VIRLAAPDIDDDDIAAVSGVLRSGQLVQGREVASFEAEVCALLGSSHAVAVGSCTAALHLALLALGIRPGDEVIVPAFSWPATANVVVFCGATPVFVDIDEQSFAMDSAGLSRAISSGNRIRAIIPVHPFGLMADIRRVMSEARTAGIPVIEDAACALGASIDGRPAGRWGTMGCFSFHPRKAVTTGEGGVIVTEDPVSARRLRMLRNHGQDPDAPSPDFVMAGLNQRMTDFQAALGRSQLRKLPALLTGRRAMAQRYDELLGDSTVRTPTAIEPSAHVYQSYVVLLRRERSGDRDAIIAQMRAAGVEASIGTHHIPLLRYYRTTFGYHAGDFPVTDTVASRAIALPLHSRLSPDDQARVVEVLRELTD